MPQAGDTIRALDFPQTLTAADLTTILNITTTAWIPGSPGVDVVFIAPTTGRVLISVGGGARSQTGGQRLWMFPEVYEGTDATGTVVQDNPGSGASAQQWGISDDTDGYQYGGTTSLLSGLTPAATYFCRHVYRVDTATSGTADITVRNLVVAPAT